MEPQPSDRATLLITVGSATVAFTIGFNLGAFGVIFFDQLLTVWVVATVILVASIFSDIPPDTWPRRLVLLVPSLWLIAAWIDNTYSLTNNDRIIFALTVVITMFVLPVVAWILITAINTDFAELPGKKKGIVVATVGLFIIIGFTIGARNDMILNCGDFKISGNDLPANCLEVTPDSP
jgi:4-amino-4-deoxy-L-arabinose transferase-like glycosyltransferase